MNPNQPQTQPPPLAKRTRRLLDAMERALQESKKQINCHEAVTECYGPDLAVFAATHTSSNSPTNSPTNQKEVNDARDMLANLLHQKLEFMNERIMMEWEQVLQNHNVNERLLLLEMWFERWEEELRTKKEEEERDRASAKAVVDAFSQSKGPLELQHQSQQQQQQGKTGVNKGKDFVSAQVHAVKLAERDRLLAELESVEMENRELTERIREGGQAVKQILFRVEQLSEGSARTADVCALAS